MAHQLRIAAPYIVAHDKGAAIVTPYNARVVEIAHELNAKFDGSRKAWVLGPRKIAQLNERHDEIIAAVSEGLADKQAEDARREKARAAAYEAAKAEGIKRRAAEQAVRDAEMAEVRARRKIIPEGSASSGDLIKWGSTWREVESVGRPFRMSEDAAMRSGYPHAWVGSLVQYAYTREASPERFAAQEADVAAKANAARIQNELANARSAAIAVIKAGEAPHLGHEPEGEEIWADRSNAIYGSVYRVILTADGWLWHTAYDGSDGGMWGDYNCGRNTTGTRIRATPELIAAIKGEV